jgi:thioester reductase-like protein
MKRSELLAGLEGTEIAVIGLACRVPGAADADAFWQNLEDGVESITDYTDEELLASGVDPAWLARPDYVKAGYELPGSDLFDAGFFGYSPRDAELIDPQQRLLMECAWEALEEAGYDSERASGPIGVFAGTSLPRYLLNIYSNPELAQSAGDLPILLGNDKDFLATRLSYKLNLKGPSVAVQTACSTSLVAVHLACQSLLAQESDLALAGGVSVNVPMRAGNFHQEGSIISRDGRTRTFDHRADGTLFGSGVGMVVLKRLSDAIEDGDHVRAVIRGTAINNDGSLKVGFTAPSVRGQAKVIAEALANAGVSADTIGYVEAHGTGTALGDPIEISALTRAFRATTKRQGFCAIGSVKTNVGHLSAAAGVISLIKAVLALEHRRLPPSLNFERPNPQIDFAASPFYVQTRLAEWPRGAAPRRAGVSSFGMGGTNAHLVLEEAPEIEDPPAVRPWRLLTVSAHTASALDRAAEKLAAHLERHPETDLTDAAYTLQVGRRAFNHRRAVVCQSLAEAVAALRGQLPERQTAGLRETENRPVAFVLPAALAGPGNPGAELHRAEPVFRQHADEAAGLLAAELGFDPRAAAGPQADTARAFIVGYALAGLLRSWGVKPAAASGQGVGEALAAHLSGALPLADAARRAAAVIRGETGAAEERRQGLPADGAPVALELGTATAPGRLACLPAPGTGPELAALLQALGGLWVAGVEVDWAGVNAREPRRRSRLPTYPFERQRFWVERANAALANIANIAKIGGPAAIVKDPRLEDWFSVPSWKRCPAPGAYAAGEGELPSGHWLIWRDLCGVADALAAKLRAAGRAVTLVDAGESFGSGGDGGYTIDPRSPEDYDRLVRQLVEAGAIPERIVHLWNVTAGSDPGLDPAAVERSGKLGFWSLLSLTQALSRHCTASTFDLTLVTSGVQRVTGEEDLQPAKASLLGLCSVVSQELLNFTCRSIDLSPAPADAGSSAAAADLLLADLASPAAEPAIAYRGGRRWVETFEPVRLGERAAGATRLRQGGVYLITGGLGHVGSVLARHLARQHAARLVLVGRSGLPPREEWTARLQAADPASERIRRVQELEALGAEVLVVTADVADAAALARAVELGRQRFGALHGVIHAAGWVGQGAFMALQDLGEATVRGHFDPKVRGTIALAQAVAAARAAGAESPESAELDFCLLTSSLSAVLGGLGHGAYSAANRFLDAFAHHQSQQTGVPWRSLNWDSWLYEEEKEAQTTRGTSTSELTMTLTEGVETLERALLLGDESQIVVSTGSLAARLALWVRLDRDRGGKKGQEIALHPRPALDIPYIAPRDDMERRVAEIWQESLGLEQVGIHDDFFELGGHSLLATQLFFRLRQAFRTELSLKVLFEAPTVAEMTRAIVRSGETGAAEPLVELDWSAEARLDPAIDPAIAQAIGPAIAQAIGPAGVPAASVERVLLTGATGFCGSFLLAELLASTRCEVRCLVRAKDEDEGRARIRQALAGNLLWDEALAERITPVVGDLARPLLGLSPRAFDELAGEVDAIYHAGALVNFIYPYSQAKAPNVLGTQEALRLAAQGRPKPFHHISTTGIIAPGYFAQAELLTEEREYGHPETLRLGYTQSKWVAEQLVRQAGERGLPVAIYRLGPVSGHSRTGVCQERDFYWLMVKACIETGCVPEADLPLPLTPVDFVSRAVVDLSTREGARGRTFHLVNPHLFSLQELVDWMIEYGYRLRRVSYDAWREALLSGVGQSDVEPILSLFSQGSIDAEVAGPAGRIPFDVSQTLAGLAGGPVRCPALSAELLTTYFSYFIRQRFLDAPAGLARSGAEQHR